MKLGIPKELKEREKRVALSPEIVGKLTKAGFEILIEQGAGLTSYFNDEMYKAAGATIVADKTKVYADADAIIKVNAPSADEIVLMKKEAVLISLMWAGTN